MTIIVDDSPELRAEALECELHSALQKLTSVLALGKDPNEAAWWLCANHGMFVLNSDNLLKVAGRQRIQAMAEAAGTPPRGGSWDDWFARLRKLQDERNANR